MKARASSSSPYLARRQGFARRMREQPTTSGRLLWAELSGGTLGVWFRRQVVIGASIADFLAPARKLVVEVGGGYHGDAGRQRADVRRDKRLVRAGYRVLHLPSNLVLSNVHEAVRLVASALGPA
jgi:very-short-patch-repair endonuclease